MMECEEVFIYIPSAKSLDLVVTATLRRNDASEMPETKTTKFSTTRIQPPRDYNFLPAKPCHRLWQYANFERDTVMQDQRSSIPRINVELRYGR